MAVPAQPMNEVDAIVESYLVRAGGNPSAALRLVIRDALADLCEADRRAGAQGRLVSHGFARGQI